MVKRRFAISLSHYFELTWCILGSIALYSAYQAELMSGLVAALTGICLVWTLLPISERLSGLRPRGAYFLFFLILALGEGIRRFSDERDLLLLVGHFLAGALPFCYFKRHHRLWSWLAFLVAAFLALSAVVSEGDFIEYICFIWFLAFGTANLNAAHLYFLAGQSEATQQGLSLKYFLQFTGSVLSGLLFGALVFVSFPREVLWANSWGMRQRQKNVGYSETVNLDGAPLNGDDSNALSFSVESDHVEYLSVFARDLYFRGRSVDSFDGTRWVAYRQSLKPYNQSKDVRVAKAHAAGIQRLKIYREPSAMTALFYPGVLRTLEVSNLVTGGTRTDGSGGLFRVRTEAVPFSYEVLVSNPLLPVEMAETTVETLSRRVHKFRSRQESPFSPAKAELDRALLIPPKIKEAEFFKKWLREVSYDKLKNLPLETFNMELKGYFAKNFRASYQHTYANGDAFQSFLSQERKGHCEYFATATTLLFRSLGIPARLVVGYHGAQFNQVSRVLEVREASAHAWVEYFVPQYGWFNLDPTPPVLGQPTAPWRRTLDAYLSALRFWFHRYVVDYNGRTQVNLFQSVTAKNLREPASGWWSWHHWRGILPWLLAPLVTYLGIRIRRRRKERRTNLPKFYDLFSEKVGKQGWKRHAGESFKLFHERLENALPGSRLLEEIDRALEKELYSSQPLPPGQKSFLEKYVRKSDIAKKAS